MTCLTFDVLMCFTTQIITLVSDKLKEAVVNNFGMHQPGPPEAICGWSGPAVVKLPIFRARSAPQNFGPRLAIFSCQEGTSASNWELPLLRSFSLAVLNVSLMRAHLRSYVPCRILLQQFSPGTRPHKSQTHNYVSTSAENGPAMAGPAGPVLAPMPAAAAQKVVWARD